MKYNLLWLLLCCAFPLLAQNALSPANYSRGTLSAPALVNGGVAPIHAIPFPADNPVAEREPNQTQYGLEATRTLGATDVELSAPQYYLGDQIALPEGEVDWNKLYDDRETYSHHFLIDAVGKAVYAVAGGTATFTWPLLDSTSVEMVCQIAYSCKGRPKRVFWTNNPYKGPTVSLNNSFVKLVGDPKLLEVKTETTTYPDSDIVIEQKTLHGIYIDADANTIHVIQGDRTKYGDLRGQFVAAYYSSGHFDELLGLQVVEVSSPEPVMLKGYVGEAVKPDGGGFPTEGLQPYPVAIMPTDDKGSYYYQHVATQPNNSQHMKVYPLRPTDSLNMRLQVWWKEADAFDTLWPFELSTYDCEWSEKPLTLVATNNKEAKTLPLRVGKDSKYTLEVEKCTQDVGASVDHDTKSCSATLSENAQMGFFTLRLTAGDNVWFVPVRVVANTNEAWFSPEVTEWLVGEEIIPRGGDASGLMADQYATEVNSELPGYIYEPASGKVWNPQLYRAPSASTNLTDETALPSAIFPVRVLNEKETQVEVWWQGSYQQEGMSSPITAPVLVQRYAPRWPKPDEAPAIVLASGLGSAGKSVAQSGRAMKLATPESALELPARRFFNEGGTLAFWMNRNATTDGQLIHLGGPLSDFTVNLSLKAGNLITEIVGLATDGTTKTLRTLSAQTELDEQTWLFVALTLEEAENPKLTLWINDEAKAVKHLQKSVAEDSGFTDTLVDANTGARPSDTAPAWPNTSDLSRFAISNGMIGAFEESAPAAAGVLLDEISLWRQALTETELQSLRYAHPSEADAGLAMAYTFEAADDLEVLTTTETQRTVTEVVTEKQLFGDHLIAHTPGAPLMGSGIIISDTEPTIYRQPDKEATGYNPNEEHAFVRTGNGGYTVWAFRCDLNKDKDEKETSAPGVLVSYSLGGKAKMKWIGVQATSPEYPTFSGVCTAGSILPGPHPFDLMLEPWLEEITWEDSLNPNTPAYRDRKLQVWARCAGDLSIKMFYRNDPSFDFPEGVSYDLQSAIEWLPKDAYTDFNGAAVDAWKWTILWPEKVPEIKLGQTLTTAVNGLPEVWNAKSMALVYTNATAVLFDPTVIQSTGPKPTTDYATTLDFVRFLGIVPGVDGVNYKGGRYTFTQSPASVADRFYIDATADLSSCIRLRGEMEEKQVGTKMLHLNVLNAQERAELVAMFNQKSPAITNCWNLLVGEGSSFAKAPIEPSKTTFPDGKAKHELITEYLPADHYALVAKGVSTNQTGYLTLLENDNPDTNIVDEGDTISMKVIKVVPELYTGSVIVREDPTNLLSQQLSVLYTEGFAGDADDFIFEWKWAEPTATGRVPENYEAGYLLHAREEGLTRFLIGAQGDTLENMVNRYFVMRYRPKEGTETYNTLSELLKKLDEEQKANTGDATGDASDATGDADNAEADAEDDATGDATGDTNKETEEDPRLWSDWCGPTLAEGWIQRVLNNVTPFTQRMTDLYTNPTETAVSMIQQAGGPYVGDVALNQDNLTNVGLIQLYATLLNKAESMSINQTSGSGAVNDQLLLAATRLADLYCVLGDEAYADALNPTIGFGADFARIDDSNIGINYGALSSGLFCFDNQVQSLLDEELALLRGRAAEDAPSKQAGPWYNRLVWNFTKGINAGEVAYAVNYNVTGSESGVLDEETAAKLYPQGHGDAYGHYLSAVKTYYRLLRNPNFSWGTPGMGEMLMADAVVNNDYYEENRFSELSGALATTAASIMERTAQKAWRDNGGLAGAGYLDEDDDRAFGYGEWGTRAALGTFYGWAVGNSLLPAGPQNESLWQFRAIREEAEEEPPTLTMSLPASCSTVATFKPNGTDTALFQPFTFEFQIEVASTQPSLTAETTATPLCFLGAPKDEEALLITRNEAGELAAVHTNGNTTHLGTLPVGERCLLAIRRKVDEAPSATATGAVEYTSALTVALFGANGLLKWETDLQEENDKALFDFNGKVLLGCGTEGVFHEIRWWQGLARTDEELFEARQKLVSESTALKFALHTYEDAATETLHDTVGRVECHVSGGSWRLIPADGLSVAFRDDGLLRINRATANDLNALPKTLASVVASFDRLDTGTSPLGLAYGAMPFDLSPVGLEDGTNTHFEQILARAETALQNAAMVLDHVQTLGNRLRQIQEAQAAYEEQLDNQEALLKAELVHAYGKPYSGDIGPGKLYVQDYDGPDLYHYMYMDLAPYGLSDMPASTNHAFTVVLDLAEGDYGYIGDGEKDLNIVEGETKIKLSYDLTADGFVAKPASVTGSRRTTGAIQQTYANVLIAYADYISAVGAAEMLKGQITDISSEMQTVFKASREYYQVKAALTTVLETAQAALSTATVIKGVTETTYVALDAEGEMIQEAIPWLVVGVANGGDAPEVGAAAAINAVAMPSKIAATTSKNAWEIANSIYENLKDFFEVEIEVFGDEVALRSQLQAYREDLLSKVYDYSSAVSDAQSASARLQAALQTVAQEVNKADEILTKRKRLRKQAADGIARLRYNDMFFRQLRNEALSRYEKAFALAQRYTYLAAQAYDYETCQLTEGLAGDDFRGEIIGARSLGVLTEEGKPMLAGMHGDAGLSDILARLKADYLVLKPRLGINNPKQELTWFSLRRELLRLADDRSGDEAWKAALMKYTVADLRTNPEFMRYCRPLASTTGSHVAEPGLVIPFETTIDFARNFFGKELIGGDSAFSPTDFATRIAGAGVAFVGYNVPAEGASGRPPLSSTPQVYLIPAGDDYFRAPGNADQVLRYSVVDQTVPLPYNVGQSQLDDPDWQPMYDGVTGGVDLGSRLRKYGSFRASVGGKAEETGSTRLVGRSVWNTRWLMIIPFGSMNNNRDEAMDAFIKGSTAYPGVSDIRLGLRTYSHEGN